MKTVLFFVIIAVAALCGIGMVAYLVGRVKRFAFVGKLSKGNPKKKGFIAFVLVAVLGVALSVMMSIINALVCLVYLSAFWLICDIISKIISKIRGKEFKRYYFGVLAIVLTLCYLTVGWYNAHNVVKTTYDIKTDKAVRPMKIISFSDTHVGDVLKAEDFKREIDNINKERPDIVLITGDFVDDSTSKAEMLSACKSLGKLKTLYGVYFTFGNHDKGYSDEAKRGWSEKDLRKALADNKVVVLEDEGLEISEGYYLLGRKDASVDFDKKNRVSAEKLLSDVHPDLYTIVMDHQPTDYEAEAKSGADLVISGHTHGGQLFPINRVGEWLGINCNTYGKERIKNTDFIVSSGMSCWEIQFKTGCFSEYIVININR